MSNLDNETLFLEGTAYWPHVRTPSEKSGKYSIDLTIDKNTANLLSEKGITIKNKKTGEGVEKKDPLDTRGNFVTLTRSLTDKEGNLLSPPRIIDAQKNLIPEEILIGNGSKVIVKANVFSWKNKFGRGIGLGFSTIQVLELVPYTHKADDGFDTREGYTIGTAGNNEDLPF